MFRARQVFASAFLALYSPLAVATVTYDTRALSGDEAPGLEAGVTFRDFSNLALSAPLINNAGETAFVARLIDPGFNFTDSLWSESGGALGLVSRSDEIGSGGVILEIHRFSFNDSGETAFVGLVEFPDTTRRRDVLLDSGGALQSIITSGNIAPGTSDSFAGPENLVLNGNGQVAFTGVLSGPGLDFRNDQGIWSQDGGGLGLVAREGNVAPGVNGMVFRNVGQVRFNDLGQTAFLSAFTSPGGSLGQQGVWSESGGSLHLVARSGDVAPGTNNNGFFIDNFGNPAFNNAGNTAFIGFIAGNGQNNNGIWASRNGSLQLVVLEGETAPGTSVEFSTLGEPVMNGAGQIAFSSSLDGVGVNADNQIGIWSEDSSGGLQLIARLGNAAPGTEAGVVYDFLSDPIINGAGQVAFSARLTDGGPPMLDEGIFATTPDGEVVLVARIGDLFDVDDSPEGEDLRTIGIVDLASASGGEDGRGTAFNDSGQLAFRLVFTDGSSGIFVATIPEPGTAGFLVLGIVGLLRRRR